MRHLKISGAANTDAAKVGGQDWDAPHAHELGDFFVVGVARWESETSAPMQNDLARGHVTGLAYANDTVSITYDTTFPLQAATEIEFSATVSIIPKWATYPTNFAVDLALLSPGQIELIYLSGAPSNWVEIFVTVYAEVVPQ